MKTPWRIEMSGSVVKAGAAVLALVSAEAVADDTVTNAAGTEGKSNITCIANMGARYAVANIATKTGPAGFLEGSSAAINCDTFSATVEASVWGQLNYAEGELSAGKPMVGNLKVTFSSDPSRVVAGSLTVGRTEAFLPRAASAFSGIDELKLPGASFNLSQDDGPGRAGTAMFFVTGASANSWFNVGPWFRMGVNGAVANLSDTGAPQYAFMQPYLELNDGNTQYGILGGGCGSTAGEGYCSADGTARYPVLRGPAERDAITGEIIKPGRILLLAVGGGSYVWNDAGGRHLQGLAGFDWVLSQARDITAGIRVFAQGDNDALTEQVTGLELAASAPLLKSQLGTLWMTVSGEAGSISRIGDDPAPDFGLPERRFAGAFDLRWVTPEF